MSEDLPYRPCVGICLLNRAGKIFAGERLDNKGAWQMPQGGIDDGEDIVTAAKRELLEEIGTDCVEIIGFHPEQLPYDIPQKTLDRLPWGKTYRGQIQSWVYARYVGDDSDINLSYFDPPEFGNWQWLSPEEINDKIVPFKIPTYTKVFDYLKTLAS